MPNRPHATEARVPPTTENGVSLNARCWGDADAPLMVLLHGAAANTHWWDHLAPRWADRFHVVAFDFRGHGDSEFPEELVPGAFADDLEAVLAHLGRDEVVLLGHSLGAHVALGHAASQPGVRALVLIDPSRGVSASRRRATRLALTLRRSYATREQAALRYRFLPAAAQVDEALRDRIAHASIRKEEDGRFGFAFDPRWFGVPGRAAPDLAQVAAPTLLVRGADSNLLSPEGASDLVEQIPNASLVEIPDAGHHVHLDQPERVVAAIERFLAEVLGAG